VILKNEMGRLIIAYCLHHGETVRMVSKGAYEVNV